MMKNKKVTVKSPSNIAFIKFWGKKNPKINIPFNNSFSMNLSACYTVTSVQFSKYFSKDVVVINGKKVDGDKWERVVRILDMIREKADIGMAAKVISKNNFPSDAGIASSASAFSALAVAGSAAAGLHLSQNELSVLARRGSGSACRSIVDGFSEWKKGDSDSNSFSVSIAGPDYWDIRDLVCIVSEKAKKSSSTEGHELAATSPYFKVRLRNLNKRTKEMKDAFKKKNFKKFGELVEEEAIDLHVMAMTSKPPVYYWNKGTIEVMEAVRNLRDEGTLCYFTIDAGPNVHVICREKDSGKIIKNLKKLKSIRNIIKNRPAAGTKILK